MYRQNYLFALSEQNRIQISYQYLYSTWTMSAWALRVSSQEKDTKDTVLPSLCFLQQFSLCDGKEGGLSGTGSAGISSLLQ